MIFTLIAVAASLIVALILVWPLLSKKHQANIIKRDQVNLQSAVTRLVELKQELKEGQITAEQFEKYQLDIETVTAEDLNASNSSTATHGKGNTIVASSVVLIVLLASIFIYQKNGFKQEFEVAQQQLAVENSKQAETDKILSTVENFIKENPEDIESRVILAQVYIEEERFSDAAAIYRELYDINPEEPDVLVNYAEALARSHGNRLIGKPTDLLNEALQLAPNHGRALWLAGFAEQQAENNEQALKHWKHLLAGIEEGSEIYQKVVTIIAETEKSKSTSTPTTLVQGDGVGTAAIEVMVTLAPEIADKLNSDTTLFVFARASEGPPMPLAVHRGTAKDLPLKVTLDDNMAMIPKMSLSNFPSVVIGARLSSNGQPQGQAGDLEGFSEIINVLENSSLELVIDSIKP
jgi:cytochrome c-type biogenesis protein CcmH